MVVTKTYCPKQGDLVWLSFAPQAGREQSGHRPALVLTPERYNRKVGLAIFCPITTQAKRYPFEVALPKGLNVGGVVLSDQAKSLDWRARRTKFCDKVPAEVVQHVLAKLATLLTP